MAKKVFEVERGVHPMYRGQEMNQRMAIDILKEFDHALSHGKILRCTGVSTAIQFLDEQSSR